MIVAAQLAGSTASGTSGMPFDEIHTTYRIRARTDDSTICVDERSAADVRVHADVAGHLRGAGWVALPSLGPGDMADAVVIGRAQAGVLELDETERVTQLHGAPGFNNAVFRFRGVKAGDSQLTFEVEPRSMSDLGWPGDLSVAEASIDVKVINCTFVMHLFSVFSVEGPAGLTFGTAMTNVELSQGSDGQFRESVDMQWFAWTGAVGDCFGQLRARSSEANVFGVLDDDGQLTVDVKYEPFNLSLTGNCTQLDTQMTPSPLHFVVASTGGSDVIDQNLTSPVGGASGAASYVILPTDEP